MDENLVTVKINKNPIINLEITTYKNEAEVNIIQSKGDKGDRGEQGLQGARGIDGLTPDISTLVNKTTTINNKSLSSNITLSTADINDSIDKRYCTDVQKTTISNISGINTGDETTSSIKTKLGIATLSGSNTGDETTSTIEAKLGASSTNITALANLTGINRGDETESTIKSKLGITTLSGSNTGDQDLSSYATNAELSATNENLSQATNAIFQALDAIGVSTIMYMLNQ